MCLIVDANTAAVVFKIPTDPLSIPIWHWLQEKDGCIVYGGHLVVELKEAGVTKLLLTLAQAGQAYLEPSWRVEEETVRLRAERRCRSDDPHVIALARISGARVLCTLDGDLTQDFKDPGLIASPRGKVYKSPERKRLLSHSSGCPRGRRRRPKTGPRKRAAPGRRR